MEQITFKKIMENQEIKTYIEMADNNLAALGYSEHSFAHVMLTSKGAKELLKILDYDERTCELAQIAGYLHDIGNVVNRVDHAQSSAIMAFQILRDMGMPPREIAQVISAIGNHDESTAVCVNEITAALILADKSDVRRSRVRTSDRLDFDIHDKVNYAVEHSDLKIDKEDKTVTLEITIDTEMCPVMSYFEIFLNRMMLCRKAAEYLSLHFALIINGVKLL